MELVYLWIEEYKNIKKQGFNFSSKFHCEYKEKILTINSRNNINIFPENINLTAIVGENGSGKSNLLEIITLLRFEKLQRSKSKFLMVYLYKDVFYTLFNTKKDYDIFDFLPSKFIKNNTNKKISKNALAANRCFWLSYFSTPLTDLSGFNDIIKSSHYSCFYNGCDGDMIFNKKFAYLLRKNNSFFKLIDKSYIFDSMRFEINFKTIYFDFYDNDIKQKVKKLKYYFENNIDTSSWIVGEEKYNLSKEDFVFNFFASYFLKKYINAFNDYYHEFNEEFQKKYKKVFFDDFIKEIENYINEKEKNSTSIPHNILILTLLKRKYQEFKKLIYKIFKGHYGQLDHFSGLTKELEVLENYDKYSNYILENFELEEDTNLLISKGNLINEKDINEYYKIIEENALFLELFSANQLYINFLDSNSKIAYNQLSTGEKSLIAFISNYTYTLIMTNENRIILLDEVESFLHPRWQKEIIYFLTEYIEYLRNEELIETNKYHLIVTSHSPFLLSDIPKDNIIFLEHGEQVHPFKENEQTFGANIHSLLSHGFFMDESGLLGEVAKKNIQRVIDFLNDKEVDMDKQNAWNIIQLIGEPYLQHKLKEKFHDKFSTKEEKKAIKIKELEDELKRLKSANS